MHPSRPGGPRRQQPRPRTGSERGRLVVAALALLCVVAPAGPSAAATPVPASITSVVAAPQPVGSGYVAVAPRRIVTGTTIGSGGSFTFAVPDLPAGAVAARLNVTATGATTDSFISACPAGTDLPTCRRTSALNPLPGEDVAAQVTVSLGGYGKDAVTLYNNAGSVKVVVDLQGFYAPEGALFLPRAPERVLPPTSMAPGSVVDVPLGTPPPGAVAVAVNVTGAGAAGATYLSACPPNQALDACRRTSTLNVHPGVDRPNMAVVDVSADPRTFRLYNDSHPVIVMVDVLGWYVRADVAPPEAARFVPIDAVRVLEHVRLGPGGLTTVRVPRGALPASATLVNVTSTRTTRVSFVSACPTGTTVERCRRSSVLNPRPRADVSNPAILKLGGAEGDAVTLYENAGDGGLSVDVVGFYVPQDPGAVVPEAPAPPPTSPVAPTAGHPTAATTGVPAGVALRPSGSLTITTAGAVVDGLDISGTVTVNADNVTIRNTRIRSTGNIPIRNNGVNLVVENTEIDGNGKLGPAVAYNKYTLRRVNIHNIGEGPRVAGGNVVIEDSYIHHLVQVGDNHTDAIQIVSGKSNIVIRRNNIQIFNPSTGMFGNAALQFGEEDGIVRGCVVEGNLMNGGNLTVNGGGGGTTGAACAFSGNRFERNFRYGVKGNLGPNTSWDSSNVWHDTGRPI